MKKFAVHLARHRRLLALGGLSLLLHLLALAWIGSRPDAAPRQAMGVPLALRLERSAAAAAQPAPQPAARVAAPQPKETTPAQAGAAPADPAPALPPLPPLQSLAPADARLASASAPSTLPGPSAAAVAAAPPARGDPRGAAVQQMPGRYRVQTPPSVRLTYAVSRTRPGGAPSSEGEAQLVWEAGGGRYQLRLEGVLGLLESEGGGDDTGIAPIRASEHQDDGSDRITRFDRAGGRIDADGARSSPLYLGSQDRASLLMQLAGMGIAAPEQMQGVIEMMVGGPDGAHRARFEVLGREPLATGAGSLQTLRLAELSEPGRRRLEIWLAPECGWLPVQLRVTEPDGSVANQVVTGIETGPAEQAAPNAALM